MIRLENDYRISLKSVRLQTLLESRGLWLSATDQGFFVGEVGDQATKRENLDIVRM